MPLRFHPLLYCLFSASALTLSWYWNCTLCVFVGFAPLLILEDHFRPDRKKIFLYSFLTFLAWNVGVTWWVIYASAGGAAMAFIFNSLFMAIVFVFYSRLRVFFPSSWGAWLIVPVWLAWEHLHTLWDLSWTWLTLGNVFAWQHEWIQWYELTGASGGSAWVLACNVVLFQNIYNKRRLLSKYVLRFTLAIVLPVALSYCIFTFRLLQELDPASRVRVTVVQPNIDPYNEKFDVDFREQFLNMLDLVRDSINESTDYLVLPETFIAGYGAGINEKHLHEAEEIQWFRDSITAKFPGLKIVAGGNTYVTYEHEATATARLDRGSHIWYDVFNTGLLIDNENVAVYHKSKLVPGVERMPFPALLKPLEGLAIDMGGTVGSLGIQSTRDVFMDTVKHVGVAPVICYESVFADYVTSYVRNGANLIFIITNDGWWDDTPGYRQHLAYARLRAIENRRDIARSANTGISCFIDRYGEVHQATGWWVPAVITRDLYKNDSLTFFSRYGDLISYLALVFTILLLMYLALATWPGKLLKARALRPWKKP